MVQFTQWSEALIFLAIFGTIIIVPCLITALMGRKMINEMGRQPTKAAQINMSIFWPLIAVMVFTFIVLIGFFKYFSS